MKHSIVLGKNAPYLSRAAVYMSVAFKLLYFLILLLPENAAAQSGVPGFRFQPYSTREGLVSNQVLSITSDANGFIWAGTQDGVSRFDGFQFQNFKLSIKDSTTTSNRNVIECVRLVGNEIWAMNRLYELYRFNSGKSNFEYSGLKGFNGWKAKDDANFPDLQFDTKRNCIWMIDSKNLVRSNLDDGTSVTYALFQEGLSNGSVVIDFRGRLWLTSLNGLIRFDPESGAALRFVAGQNIICQVLAEPYLWFTGNLDSLYRLDLRNDALQRFSTYSPIKMPGNDTRDAKHIFFFPALSGDSILWTALEHGGLLIFNLRDGKEVARFFSDETSANQLVNDNIFDFYSSHKGSKVIWLASESGLLKIDSREQFFRTFPIPEFKKNSIGRVRTVLTNQQNKAQKWVLSNADGLFLYHEKNKQLSKPPFSPSGSSTDLREMAFDSQKNLTIIGAKGLLQVMQNGRLRQYHPKFQGVPLIRFFAPINEDSIWVCNKKEAGLFLTKTQVLLPSAHIFSDVYYLNQGAEGSLLVSELNGLFRVPLSGFDPVKGIFSKVENIALPEGEKEGYDVLEDGPFIWAVLSNGLGKLEKSSGKWTIYGEKEGLSNMRIRSIVKDRQGNLWLNSDNGLFVFFPLEQRFKRFSENDGLPNNLIGGQLSEDGEWLHAAFVDAYMSWKPTVQLQKEPKKPIFTGFWALNRPVCLHPDSLGTAFFEVPHRDNILRFDFTCTDYYQSEKITFEYQLEGFDEQVVAAGTSRRATYTNLDGGDYTFKVWAINADGYRSAEPALLHFRVIPPFYRTWWFLALCLLAAGGVIYALFQFRLRQQLEKEAIRQRIARDLHDEVGSTLTTISILSESAMRQLPTDGEQAGLSGIGEKARAAMSSMGDIVWAVNPQNDSMDKVVERMIRFCAEILEPPGIRVVFDIESDINALKMPMEQRKDFYLFFKEAVTNVAKHSGASGVRCTLNKTGTLLHFSLEDDGQGLPAVAPGTLGGNGLLNMQTRAGALGAEFQIKNAENGGCRVDLYVPMP
jgi:ligand-binding sensor domain-containing protein/two-component sensor histidine kinase